MSLLGQYRARRRIRRAFARGDIQMFPPYVPGSVDAEYVIRAVGLLIWDIRDKCPDFNLAKTMDERALILRRYLEANGGA